MAILDLQGMEEEPVSKGAAGHSGASKNCGNGGPHFSSLSLLLCD